MLKTNDPLWGVFALGKEQHIIASILNLGIIFPYKLPHRTIRKEEDAWIQSTNVSKVNELF